MEPTRKPIIVSDFEELDNLGAPWSLCSQPQVERSDNVESLVQMSIFLSRSQKSKWDCWEKIRYSEYPFYRHTLRHLLCDRWQDQVLDEANGGADIHGDVSATCEMFRTLDSF